MLKQNAGRYRRDGDSIVISAGPAVTPLRIGLSEPIELLPALAAEGVIVFVAGRYLVGPSTYRALADARSIDPHYWYRENGRIQVGSGSDTAIGRTVPIISVDLTRLEEAAAAQGFALRTAGVVDVDWNWDDAGPVPEGILRQINWTLSASAERPGDTYQLGDLGLDADYSYEALRIAEPAPGGRIDPDAIGEIVRRVSGRLQELRADFNRIQSIYFDGSIDPAAGVLPPVTVVYDSNSTPTADPSDSRGRQRIRRNSVLVDVAPDPTNRANGDSLINPDVLEEISAIAAAAVVDPLPPPTNAPTSPVDAARSSRRGADIVSTIFGLSPIGLIARLFKRKRR